GWCGRPRRAAGPPAARAPAAGVCPSPRPVSSLAPSAALRVVAAHQAAGILARLAARQVHAAARTGDHILAFLRPRRGQVPRILHPRAKQALEHEVDEQTDDEEQENSRQGGGNSSGYGDFTAWLALRPSSRQKADA